MGKAAVPDQTMDAPGVLAYLRSKGTSKVRDQMSERFGIKGDTASTALGIPVGDLRTLAKQLRGRGKSAEESQRRHALALALWGTGQYEAMLVACFVDEPALVTVAQMNAWAKDFDNWAVCDTACFCLFDRTPWDMVEGRVRAWSKAKAEFVRRAGFALIASRALHDKKTDPASFEPYLDIIEAGAGDDRNFVKKAVSWALRGLGKRGGPLRAQAITLARRLAASDEPAARWVGRDALRDLSKA